MTGSRRYKGLLAQREAPEVQKIVSFELFKPFKWFKTFKEGREDHGSAKNQSQGMEL